MVFMVNDIMVALQSNSEEIFHMPLEGLST